MGDEGRSAWRRAVETRLEIFLEEWGADLAVQDISQTHIDRYRRRRMAGTLSAERTRMRKAVRAGTVDGELRWLSSVFNFCRHHKVHGKRLLQENPLHDVKWEREVNVRRPVASHQRFEATLEHVDTVDPAGRLRCMLNLARYTGRRESAICKLRASDFLRDPDAIRAALAAMGFDENRADHMPHGAVRWTDENDKQGFATISPLGATARAALEQPGRIGRDSCYVESTADSTFGAATGNSGRRTLLHGKDALTDEQAAMLGREVRVTLPFPQDDPQHLQGRIGASTLGDVLEGLSEQLGITVTADERMHRLPVNPVVMTNVRVATAIELLIRQWLVPEFVYSVDDTGIRLRHMPPR